jgi:hypothetical protein
MLCSELCAKNISFAGKNMWTSCCSVLNVLCTKSTKLILEIIMFTSVYVSLFWLYWTRSQHSWFVNKDPAIDMKTHLADRLLLLILWWSFLVPIRISGRLAIIPDVLVFFLSFSTLIGRPLRYTDVVLSLGSSTHIRQTGCHCSSSYTHFWNIN